MKERILEVLKNAEKPLRPGEIAAALGEDKDAVSKAIKELKAEEKIYVSADKEIAFTVYNQQDNARHIYLLPLNNLKNSAATLNLGRVKYKIDVPLKTMLKIVAKDSVILSHPAEVVGPYHKKSLIYEKLAPPLHFGEALIQKMK